MNTAALLLLCAVMFGLGLGTDRLLLAERWRRAREYEQRARLAMNTFQHEARMRAREQE